MGIAQKGNLKTKVSAFDAMCLACCDGKWQASALAFLCESWDGAFQATFSIMSSVTGSQELEALGL